MKKFVLSHSIIQSIFQISVKYQYLLIFLVQKLENFSKFINEVAEGSMSSL